MPSNKKKTSRAKEKKEEVQEIAEAIQKNTFENPNPIKRLIKVKQFPWTSKQKEFFKIALDPKTRVVLVDGPAGSSKTLLSVYCGLQLLNQKVISDIMYLRSAVESSSHSLGFLPGSAEDKLRFYNLPFLDKMDELLESTRAEKLESEGRISVFPVNFARGMNWNAKCIILDEAQNSTEKEITTVLTRMGKSSRCFILADPMQTDLKNSNLSGGFKNFCNLFDDDESREQGIHIFKFNEDDIMRSEIIKFIIKKIQLDMIHRRGP